MLECVVNVSCGEPGPELRRIVGAGGDALADVHSDEHHNRSVLTLGGPAVEAAARAVAVATIESLDLREHRGVHPRIGVLDVVPFVPLSGSTMADALAARDAFAAWAAVELSLPCFLYGPERSLPDVRRYAWDVWPPDAGPPTPHPTAGACAVGAREVLVAYNIWLAEPDLDGAKAIAAAVRGPHVKALGLPVGDRVQVSMNLVSPLVTGPGDVYDVVAARAAVAGAELVGLAPMAVLEAVDESRWAQLDLAPERTIEHRLGIDAVATKAAGPDRSGRRRGRLHPRG